MGKGGGIHGAYLSGTGSNGDEAPERRKRHHGYISPFFTNPPAYVDQWARNSALVNAQD